MSHSIVSAFAVDKEFDGYGQGVLTNIDIVPYRSGDGGMGSRMNESFGDGSGTGGMFDGGGTASYFTSGDTRKGALDGSCSLKSILFGWGY